MSVDSEKDVQGLKRAGRVVALTLKAMGEAVREGITTAELDQVAAGVLAEHGTRGMDGRFPAWTEASPHITSTRW